MDQAPRGRTTQSVEVAAALLLLGWRVFAAPQVWRDWIALLAAYWIYTIFGSRSESWPWVTGGTMILLALIYLQGQFPHTLSALGIGS